MMPDPDAAPEPPETASAPAVLSAVEHRAVDAAVAGVAGLLVGRALFGRAGGLVAGLVAVGAGLLAKRRPELKKREPDTTPVNGSTPAVAVPAEPVTQVRLETGRGTVDDSWTVMAKSTLPAMAEIAPPVLMEAEPESVTPATVPEDAGAFAEMPALFGNDRSAAEAAPVPAPDVFPAVKLANPAGPVVFDDGPAPVEVNILPVADLVSLADEALEREIFPEEHAVPGRPKSPPVPAAQILGLLEDFPAEFAAYKEEEAPGPREEFLLIPDASVPAAPAEAVPPIQSIVAALSEPLRPAAAPQWEKEADKEEIKLLAAAAAPANLDAAILPAEPVATSPAADLEKEKGSPLMPAPSADTPFRVWTAPATAPAFPSQDDATPAPAAVQSVSPPPFPLTPVPVPAAPITPAVETVPVHLPMPMVATVPIRLSAPMVATVPIHLPPPPAPASPAEDPEEIWRQAAAELTAVRQASAKGVPSSPVLPEGLLPGAPAFPALPDVPGVTPPFLGAPPSFLQAGDPESPPWLKPPPAEVKPAAERTGHDPSRHSAFLPTIKLSVPQGPQPLTARRPIPLPPDNSPAPAPAMAPVLLPGYRAEQVLPVLPAPAVAGPVPNKDESQAVLASLPPPPAAFAAVAEGLVPSTPDGAPVVLTAAMSPPPAFAAAAQLSPASGEEKVFVPRVQPRLQGPKRPFISGIRVVILAAVAALALGLAFKPQLKKLWEEKILGHPAERVREKTLPISTETESEPDDGTGVRVVPDETSPPKSTPAPAVAPPAAPDKTAPESAPPSPETPGVPSVAVPPAAPAPETPTVPPQPAGSESTARLPASETGARELIARLLRASAPDAVKPYIFDSDRLAPALESYFSSGKAVPVATSESFLERTDKSAVTGRTVWLFRVTTDKLPRGFPLAVEDAPDGLRADWELFTQCRDGVLKTFLADTSAPRGVYYTALMRKHIFPDMLPDKDHTKYFAFDVSSPSLGDTTFNVFIPKSTPLAARADNLYKFSVPYGPVLELTHKDGHVEITGIVRENWRVSSRSGSR